MQKIPTLFLRDPDDPRSLTRTIHPDCQWVIDGEGTATRKYDGTCVMYDGESWWARREVKPGKAAPEGFVAVQTDPVTGKTVGWEPAERSGFAKFHAEAVDALIVPVPGTYELCGPKINQNPEGYQAHILVQHEFAEVLDDGLAEGGDPFDALRNRLRDFPYEGIVWHHPDGRRAKIKRRDFPTEGR